MLFPVVGYYEAAPNPVVPSSDESINIILRHTLDF